MTYFVLFSILIGVNFSFAKSARILSQGQFQNLSREDQILYLQGLQKILIKMSEKSPYLAEERITSNRMPANAQTANVKQNYTEYLVLEEANSLLKAQSEPTPEKSGVVTLAKSSKAENKTDSFEDFGNLANRDPVPPPPPPQKKKSDVQKPDTQKADARKPDIQKPETKDNPTQDADRPHFRCMYAGWIVEQDPCSPPEQLPAWMSYDGMKEENKSCLRGMATCNPVVFGLRLPKNCQKFSDCPDKAKPICIYRGTDATRKCARESAKDGDKGTRIAAELNNKVNPRHYERYQSMFKDLCDEDQIKANPFADFKNGKRRSAEASRSARKDIQMTCQWAADQIEKLNASVAGSGNNRKSPSQEPKGTAETQGSETQQ